MTKQMKKLIVHYQLSVFGFVKAFQQQFGIESIFGALTSGVLPEKGTLDDRYETRFEFHGSGCRVESTRGIVDFDFGPEGRIDGFDGWRLWIFAESLPDKYPEFQRYEIVESVLGELVTDGEVVRPRWMPSPHLCYLATDVA